MSRPTMGRVTVHTYITKRLLEQLDAFAQADGRTRTDLVNEAIRDYLANYKRRNRYSSSLTLETPLPSDHPGDGDL